MRPRQPRREPIDPAHDSAESEATRAPPLHFPFPWLWLPGSPATKDGCALSTSPVLRFRRFAPPGNDSKSGPGMSQVGKRGLLPGESGARSSSAIGLVHLLLFRANSVDVTAYNLFGYRTAYAAQFQREPPSCIRNRDGGRK